MLTIYLSSSPLFLSIRKTEVVGCGEGRGGGRQVIGFLNFYILSIKISEIYFRPNIYVLKFILTAN